MRLGTGFFDKTNVIFFDMDDSLFDFFVYNNIFNSDSDSNDPSGGDSIFDTDDTYAEDLFDDDDNYPDDTLNDYWD